MLCGSVQWRRRKKWRKRCKNYKIWPTDLFQLIKVQSIRYKLQRDYRLRIMNDAFLLIKLIQKLGSHWNNMRCSPSACWLSFVLMMWNEELYILYSSFLHLISIVYALIFDLVISYIVLISVISYLIFLLDKYCIF